MWKVLAGGAAVAALLAGSFFTGRTAGWDARDAGAKGEQLQAAVAQVDQLQAAQREGFEAGRRAVDHQLEIREKTRLIHDLAPVLLPPDVDRRFPLPWGFVRLLDAAAAGELPAAAPGIDGEASSVAASAAGGTIADNYGTCRATAQQLRDLQDWAAKQAGLSIE